MKIIEHSQALENNPEYRARCEAVDAAAKALDEAFTALEKAFPLEEPDAIYCVFGDGKVRPSHTTKMHD